MDLLNRIHKLDEGIRNIKTSQGLGSSSSELIKIGDINVSGTLYDEAYLIILFRSFGNVNPFVAPELSVLINGQTPSGASDFSATSGCYLTYDRGWIETLLKSFSQWQNVTFNEYTFPLMIVMKATLGQFPPLNVQGSIYATDWGAIETYLIEAPPIP